MQFSLTGCDFSSIRLHKLREVYKIGSRLSYGQGDKRHGSITEDLWGRNLAFPE